MRELERNTTPRTRLGAHVRRSGRGQGEAFSQTVKSVMSREWFRLTRSRRACLYPSPRTCRTGLNLDSPVLSPNAGRYTVFE